MKNKETVFRVGDKVYDSTYCWGVVRKLSVCTSIYFIEVAFDNGKRESYDRFGRSYVDRPKSLSFTEYDYTNGGFSQERPFDKFAELKEAHRNGEKIEFFYCGNWTETDNPIWGDNDTYRIKPKEGFMKFRSLELIAYGNNIVIASPKTKDSVVLRVNNVNHILDRQNLETLNNYLNLILEK